MELVFKFDGRLVLAKIMVTKNDEYTYYFVFFEEDEEIQKEFFLPIVFKRNEKNSFSFHALEIGSSKTERDIELGTAIINAIDIFEQ
jgi:hypothetical protein